MELVAGSNVPCWNIVSPCTRIDMLCVHSQGWTCWRDGGAACPGSTPDQLPVALICFETESPQYNVSPDFVAMGFRATGMASLLGVVRAQGAINLVHFLIVVHTLLVNCFHCFNSYAQVLIGGLQYAGSSNAWAKYASYVLIETPSASHFVFFLIMSAPSVSPRPWTARCETLPPRLIRLIFSTAT